MSVLPTWLLATCPDLTKRSHLTSPSNHCLLAPSPSCLLPHIYFLPSGFPPPLTSSSPPAIITFCRQLGVVHGVMFVGTYCWVRDTLLFLYSKLSSITDNWSPSSTSVPNARFFSCFPCRGLGCLLAGLLVGLPGCPLSNNMG